MAIRRTAARIKLDLEQVPENLKVSEAFVFASIGLVEKIISKEERQQVLQYLFGKTSVKELTRKQKAGWVTFVGPKLAETAKDAKWVYREDLEGELRMILNAIHLDLISKFILVVERSGCKGSHSWRDYERLKAQIPAEMTPIEYDRSIKYLEEYLEI